MFQYKLVEVASHVPKELNFGEQGWKLWPLGTFMNGTSFDKYRGANIPYENRDTWL